MIGGSEVSHSTSRLLPGRVEKPPRHNEPEGLCQCPGCWGNKRSQNESWNGRIQWEIPWCHSKAPALHPLLWLWDSPGPLEQGKTWRGQKDLPVHPMSGLQLLCARAPRCWSHRVHQTLTQPHSPPAATASLLPLLCQWPWVQGWTSARQRFFFLPQQVLSALRTRVEPGSSERLHLLLQIHQQWSRGRSLLELDTATVPSSGSQAEKTFIQGSANRRTI